MWNGTFTTSLGGASVTINGKSAYLIYASPTNGLACCLGKLVHLGIDVAPNKSTLSYANMHRPAELYEDLF
jgi:hypothetical protein